MSTETQNNAPVSAEPVVTLNGAQLLQALDFIAPDRDTDPQQLECELTISFADGPAGSGYYCYCTDYPDEGAIMLDAEAPAAPVAAQPDLTQQTLDDVMAGIPARDAEIAELRKQVETLQAQLVDRSTEMQRNLVDETPNLQSQQQPVSGADGLPQGWRMVPEKIPMKGLNDAIAWMRPAMNQAGRDLAYCLTGAWSILLDSVAPPDHLPDATKMVEPSVSSGEFEKFAGRKLMEAYKAGMHGKNFNIPEAVDSITRASMDQFRDAAKMIEPSGNSGELEVSVHDALDWYAQQVGNCRKFGPVGDAARADLDADGGRRARAALAQQDVYKTTFEEWHNKTEFVQKWMNTRKLSAKYLGWHRADVMRDLLEKQDADKVDAALAEMVHAMFRSGNSVPVTRITIDRKQYEAAIDAASKEQA